MTMNKADIASINNFMASKQTPRLGNENPLFLTDEELRQAIELMYFAYRHFISESDSHLNALGLGRAHHRVIYFISRHPDMPVSHLIKILKITKQSLSRVLADLIKKGFVHQSKSPEDGRQKLLSLTPKGMELEAKLTKLQSRLIANAYKQAGVDAVGGFKKVMLALSDDDGENSKNG